MSDETNPDPKPTPPPAMEHRPAPRPNRPSGGGGGPGGGPSRPFHPRPGMRPDGSTGAPQRGPAGAPAGGAARGPQSRANPVDSGDDKPTGEEDFGPRAQKPPREKPGYEAGKPPALNERELPTSQVSLRDLDKAIEAELEAALAGVGEDSLFAEPADGKSARRDPNAQKVDRTKGKVVSIHHGDIFIEVPGSRSQGVMSAMQFDTQPKVGDIVEYDVERFDPTNGLLILTRKGGAAVDVDWSSVAIGMVVDARVTAVNKGGLSVEVQGIRGFLPISQIDMYRVENVDQYLGQKIRCMVAEVDVQDKNLVVSRRALLEKERESQREEFWAKIEVGQVKEGIVRSVKPFGVFVDLGGADGMIPVSELSWGRVNDPLEVVSIGQKVEVKVSRLDTDARKIGLSLKAMGNSPWTNIRERIHAGLQITGPVTRIMEFGAFVEVEPGIEGLIHISELGKQRVRKVGDVLKVGQEVTVQVVNVDLEQRRVALSLRAVEEAARKNEEAAMAASRPGAVAAPVEPEAPVKPRVKPTNLRGGGSGSGGKLFPDLPSARN